MSWGTPKVAVTRVQEETYMESLRSQGIIRVVSASNQGRYRGGDALTLGSPANSALATAVAGLNNTQVVGAEVWS